MMLRLSFRRIKLFHDEFPLEKQLNLTKRCLSDHVSGNNSGQEIQIILFFFYFYLLQFLAYTMQN